MSFKKLFQSNSSQTIKTVFVIILKQYLIFYCANTGADDEEAVLCKIAAASAWIKAVAPNLTGCHCIVHCHVLTVKNKMKQKKESPSIT